MFFCQRRSQLLAYKPLFSSFSKVEILTEITNNMEKLMCT